MISIDCEPISLLILFHSDFTSIMTGNNKPLNLLKELRDEIGMATSVYSAEEDKEKQERMVSIATCKNIGFRRDPGWNRSSNNLLVVETDYIGLFCLFVWGFPLEKYLTPIEMLPLPVKGSKY